MFSDLVKTVAGKVGDIGDVKDDVLLLKDEAQEIMQEIEELQKLAVSLLERQVRVMESLGRLKNFAGLD